MRVALCLTVLNEANSIDQLLDSITAQTLIPDEVVIVDGGSHDGTVARIHDWTGRGPPTTVLVQPGANISQGRNLAIRTANAEVIAVTDGGVTLDPGWLEQLVGGFATGNDFDVVSGFFRSDARTPFELALGAATLPREEEINPSAFLPSSRSVAFKRSAWESVGGYPEWLDYCEDLVFDLALVRAGFRFAWRPGALVHFRPRATITRFFPQYYRYARGDGKADLWRTRHAIRYATYVSLALGVAFGARIPLTYALLGLGACAYVRRPYLRLVSEWAGWSPLERLKALAWIPAVRLVGDLAKMMGYPAGIWWRLRHHKGGSS